MKQSCCANQAFVRHQDADVADIGHAEGIEFTIGKCSSCQSPLMHVWVAGGVSEGVEIIEPTLVDRLVQTPAGKQRKTLLVEWWNGQR